MSGGVGVMGRQVLAGGGGGGGGGGELSVQVVEKCV